MLIEGIQRVLKSSKAFNIQYFFCKDLINNENEIFCDKNIWPTFSKNIWKEIVSGT